MINLKAFQMYIITMTEKRIHFDGGKFMLNAKKWYIIIALFVFAAILAACSEEKSGEEPNTGGESKDPVAPVQEPVELDVFYMWSGYTKEEFMDDYGNHIVNKYPYISINWIQNEAGTTLADVIAAKTNIDMVLTTNNAYLVLEEHGFSGDVTDLAKKYQYDFGKMDPGVYEVLKAAGGGNPPGIPYKANSLGFFYNKDVFDKFGVDYVTDGMTWDEVYEKAKLLTRVEGDTTYRGLGIRNTNFINLNQLSLPLYDASGKKAAFDSQPWKDYLENFIRFYQLPSYDANLETIDFSNVYDMFVKDQTLAMLIQQNSDWPRVERGVNINWDAVTFPSFASHPGVGPQPEIVFFALPDVSKNRDAAFLAMASLTDDEQVIQSAKKGAAPVMKGQQFRDIYGSEAPDLKGKNAIALIPSTYANSIALSNYNGWATGSTYQAMVAVMLGEKDMNTALRESVEGTNQYVEETEAGFKKD